MSFHSICNFQGAVHGKCHVMGLSRLELPTSRLSGVRSNLLSYKPKESGILLFSRAVSSKVPSAVCGLTVVFGMGTGISRIRIDTTSSSLPPR